MPILKRIKLEPDLTGEYYFINYHGSISQAYANNTKMDKRRYKAGNYYESLNEAYKELLTK